jgi:hypothetical protein
VRDPIFFAGFVISLFVYSFSSGNKKKDIGMLFSRPKLDKNLYYFNYSVDLKLN